MIACKNSENLKQRKTVQESHPDGIHIESIYLLYFEFVSTSYLLYLYKSAMDQISFQIDKNQKIEIKVKIQIGSKFSFIWGTCCLYGVNGAPFLFVEKSRMVESMRRESTDKKRFLWGSLFRLYDMLKLFYVSIASKSERRY